MRIYLADSFPVPVCQNIRIKRCKIYQDECFRGRVSSRKEYFYGLKVHALITESGFPVEIFLSPGSYADVNALSDFSFPVHSGSAFMETERIIPIILKMILNSQMLILILSGRKIQKENMKHLPKMELSSSEKGLNQFHRHRSNISSAYSCCHGSGF